MQFNDAMLIFIADCLSVTGMKLGKVAAVKEMTRRANTMFRDFIPTPERVAEVRSVILAAA